MLGWHLPSATSCQTPPPNRVLCDQLTGTHSTQNPIHHSGQTPLWVQGGEGDGVHSFSPACAVERQAGAQVLEGMAAPTHLLTPHLSHPRATPLVSV